MEFRRKHRNGRMNEMVIPPVDYSDAVARENFDEPLWN